MNKEVIFFNIARGGKKKRNAPELGQFFVQCGVFITL